MAGSLLVDKSLVIAEVSPRGMRYRLLETVRQYALEKLGESGEADAVRAHHRDHYTAMAAQLDSPALAGNERRLEQAETEMDNLRAAFTWSHENAETEVALALTSSLQAVWLSRGRIQEGLAWFNVSLTDAEAHHTEIAPAVWARGLADKLVLDAWVGATRNADQAEQALAIARQLNEPALLLRALTAHSYMHIAGYNTEVARPYVAEAISLARAVGDDWRLSQILAFEAYAGIVTGDPTLARKAAEEGRMFADAIGDRFNSRACRLWFGYAKQQQGHLAEGAALFSEVVAEAEAAHDVISSVIGLAGLGWSHAYQGDTTSAGSAARAAIEAGADFTGLYQGIGYAALAIAMFAAGDVAGAEDSSDAAARDMSVQPETAVMQLTRVADATLARGDLATARRLADEAVPGTMAWPYHAMQALTVRARVAVAHGELEQAERDAHDALERGAAIGAYVDVPDILECLARVSADTGGHREAARLFGAAEAARRRMGAVRFKIYDAPCDASVAALRDAMGDKEFDEALAEGAAMSTDEAIAYAQRGRGERQRPSSGWASLTPAERDVVRLVTEGLANNDIAARLFVSPRTVQSHLTHVYAKLGLTSRLQLAHEAARHP